MMFRRGLSAIIDPSVIGITVFDPSTDNAALLQQDAVTLAQQAAAATAAAQQPATPTPSPSSGILMLAAVGVAGYFAWKAGWFSGFMQPEGMIA